MATYGLPPILAAPKPQPAVSRRFRRLGGKRAGIDKLKPRITPYEAHLMQAARRPRAKP